MNRQQSIFHIGDTVTWLQQLRGGYGYVIPVPAVVVGFGEKRIKISASLKNGGSKVVYVLPSNLKKFRQ